MFDYTNLGWWLGHGFELVGITLVGGAVAFDLYRGSGMSRPLVGDLRAVELVTQEEAFLGSHVRALLVSLAEKDASTEEHTRRVALRAVEVGEELGLPAPRLRGLALGGLLHDMGKLAVPGEVLRKPGSLDDDEFDLVKRHPQAGVRLLRDLGGFSDTALGLVRHHHERLDGSGYPDGIGGDDLDVDTRILAVCDVYDALVSPRVYREPWSHERAIALLRDEALFDQRCVEALERVIGRERAVRARARGLTRRRARRPGRNRGAAPHKKAWRSVAACAPTGPRRDASATVLRRRLGRVLDPRRARRHRPPTPHSAPASARSSRAPTRVSTNRTQRSSLRHRRIELRLRSAGLWTFRGNERRAFYGVGPVPRRSPRIVWRYPRSGNLCSRSADEAGVQTWCGIGWTGQPNVIPRPRGRVEVRVGAFDRAYHFVDGATGRRVRPSLPTGDLAKGSATSDPDGYPLYYAGSRDNRLRVVALDRGRPTVLWSLDSYAGHSVTWNDDWDGAPLVVQGHLLVGGENSWFYVIRLNRRYGKDGKVRVRPRVVARVPGLGRPSARRSVGPCVLDRVVGLLPPRRRVLRQLGRARPGLGRAPHAAGRCASPARVSLLDG